MDVKGNFNVLRIYYNDENFHVIKAIALQKGKKYNPEQVVKRKTQANRNI